MQTLSTTDQLIREFAESGEPYLLGVIADSLQEEGRLPELSEKCREWLEQKQEVSPLLFFWNNANCSHDSVKESREEGRLRCGFALVDAEGWLDEVTTNWRCNEVQYGDYRISWSEDFDHYDEFSPDVQLWECYLQVWTVYGWSVAQARHGIDLGKGNPDDCVPYTRVVEAELALEEMKM